MLASVVIMATRAPKSTQTAGRPKGGGRAEPAPRGRPPKKNSRSTKKRTTQSSKTRGRGRQLSGPRKTPPSVSAHPLLILLGWGASAVAGVWMLLAHGIGAVARGVGRSAAASSPRTAGTGSA